MCGKKSHTNKSNKILHQLPIFRLQISQKYGKIIKRNANQRSITLANKENLGKKVIAVNRKARHDYFVEDTYEAGIALYGTEVKSLRAGQVNLKDSYCTVRDGELFALGIHISPYEKGNIYNREPLREKKLLMHKREILKLFNYVSRDSYTLIPLSLYFSGSNVKVEVGLCKGKKLWDKRESDAKSEANREIERASKSRIRRDYDD